MTEAPNSYMPAIPPAEHFSALIFSRILTTFAEDESLIDLASAVRSAADGMNGMVTADTSYYLLQVDSECASLDPAYEPLLPPRTERHRGSLAANESLTAYVRRALLTDRVSQYLAQTILLDELDEATALYKGYEDEKAPSLMLSCELRRRARLAQQTQSRSTARFAANRRPDGRPDLRLVTPDN